ncbi:MAG TPA: hypothetical protein VN934_01165 [Candidatus Tumulicola sp.]|nr:hypothetical protein [Candidatus Tumulicola sp.]
MKLGPLVAGVALGSVISGAAPALIALPPAVLILAAGIVAAMHVRASRSSLIALFTGAALGLALPQMPPENAGPVIARPVGRHPGGDLFALLDRIDRDPASVLGKRVSVSGEWTPPRGGRSAAVSRRIMTCCAADAIDVGFDVTPASPIALAAAGTRVRVSGALHATLRDGELRYELSAATLKRL